MSQPALSLQFFDPAHGLHGSARSGMTLLFDDGTPRALDDGPAVSAAGGGWHAELAGELSLDFEPVAVGATLDGIEAHVCRVSGTVGGRTVRCLGTVAETREPPAWGELDALRTISALFDERHALLAVASRPRGASGHDAEHVDCWLLDDGEPVRVAEARISTVYDGAGRQRSAGLELWIAEEEPPLRASGSVVAGSSLQLEGLEVHAAVFRWRVGDREGAGAYELMARTEDRAAA